MQQKKRRILMLSSINVFLLLLTGYFYINSYTEKTRIETLFYMVKKLMTGYEPKYKDVKRNIIEIPDGMMKIDIIFTPTFSAQVIIYLNDPIYLNVVSYGSGKEEERHFKEGQTEKITYIFKKPKKLTEVMINPEVHFISGFPHNRLGGVTLGFSLEFDATGKWRIIE